jgi:uncharacterized membrane protein YraQ (UPF0718 family)
MVMRKPKLDWTTWFLVIVAIGLAGVAWAHGGVVLALAGLKLGGYELLRVTPLLIAAFLVAGLTQALVSPKIVERWLSSQAGWRGILVACIGGAVIPGGPYVYYPIAGALLQSGAGIGVLISFISAKNLWALTRLPYEFALLGSNLTIIRIVLTFAIPPLLGFLAELFFGRTITKIREAVR